MPTTSARTQRPRPRLALLLLGGGARAAYQVGFLRCMARRMPDVRFSILCGVSSGAINTTHLASRTCPFPDAVDQLHRLWSGLTPERIMRVDSLSLAKNVVTWALRLVSGGHHLVPEARGMVDCGPLQRLLARHLEGPDGTIDCIRENLDSGRLEAVTVATTKYTTAESVTFVQGRGFPEEWSRPKRIGVRENLTVDHVMASAALPLLFPAVHLPDGWYGDGGIRMATPLSPPIALGADRILAISTHFEKAGRIPEWPVVEGYPPPAQVIGTLFNALFLDRLHEDVRRLERVNELLDGGPPGAAKEIGRSGRTRKLRKVEAFVLRPSRDLGKLAGDFEEELPRAFRFMIRGLGTRETASPDLLSMMLFEPGYLRLLMDLGEEDAEARSDELEAFVRAGVPA